MTKNRNVYKKLSYDFLYDEHVNKNKSIKIISQELNLNENSIRERFKDLNLTEILKCNICGTFENLKVRPIRGKIVTCNICNNCASIRTKLKNNLNFSYDFLYKLHVIDKFSFLDISQKYDVSVKRVTKFFKFYSIPEIKRCQYCKTEENLFIYIKKTGVIITSNLCNSCKSSRFSEIRKNESEEKKLKRLLASEKTNLERYGVSNIWKKKEYIKQKTKEKLGEDNVRKTEKFKDNSKKVKKERYGDENYNNRDKSKETCLKNHGKEYGFIGKGKNYSKISQKLFWDIYNLLPQYLQEHTYFAELNKEFHCYDKANNKNYFYDFVITNIKVCIEFDGNAWHYHFLHWKGHPTDKNITPEDLVLRDNIKRDYLKDNYGYYIFNVWEHEYKQVKCMAKMVYKQIMKVANA